MHCMNMLYQILAWLNLYLTLLSSVKSTTMMYWTLTRNQKTFDLLVLDPRFLCCALQAFHWHHQERHHRAILFIICNCLMSPTPLPLTLNTKHGKWNGKFSTSERHSTHNSISKWPFISERRRDAYFFMHVTSLLQPGSHDRGNEVGVRLLKYKHAI